MQKNNKSGKNRSLYLPFDLLEWLEKKAAIEDRSVNYMVNKAIRLLKDCENKKKGQ